MRCFRCGSSKRSRRSPSTGHKHCKRCGAVVTKVAFKDGRWINPQEKPDEKSIP